MEALETPAIQRLRRVCKLGGVMEGFRPKAKPVIRLVDCKVKSYVEKIGCSSYFHLNTEP